MTIVSHCSVNEVSKCFIRHTNRHKSFLRQVLRYLRDPVHVCVCVEVRSSDIQSRLSGRTFSFFCRSFLVLCSCRASVYQREFAFIAPCVRVHTYKPRKSIYVQPSRTSDRVRSFVSAKSLPLQAVLRDVTYESGQSRRPARTTTTILLPWVRLGSRKPGLPTQQPCTTSTHRFRFLRLIKNQTVK